MGKKKVLTKEEKRRRAQLERAKMKAEVKAHPRLAAVYVILRVLVLAVMVLQITNREWYDVFLCALTLTLFLIPSFVERRLHIDVPNTLEVIILLFIFSAEILGEIQEYYLIFPFWDTMLHTLNGFLMAAIGIAMVDILNRSRKFKVRLSPAFVAVVAFCFSMTIGVLWEFFEYGMDCFFGMDMQKDTWVTVVNSVSLHPDGKNIPVSVPIESVAVNGEAWPGYLDIGLHDTMKDLLVNFIGAAIFSVIGMFYIMGRGKGWFAPRFIPRLKKEELEPKEEEKGSLLDPIPLDEAVPEKPEGDEAMDVYTPDGLPAGRAVSRGTGLGEKEFYQGIHVFLYDNRGRFLLQKRSETAHFRPGRWDITMGHALSGESSLECAAREVKEELGMDLPPESFIKVYRMVTEEDHFLTDIYFARAELDERRLRLQKEEVTGVQLLTREEMLEFIKAMEYRPQLYRQVLCQYIEACVAEKTV